MTWKQTSKILKQSTHCTTVRNAQQDRLSNAVLAIQKANGMLSLSQAAKHFDVSKSTLSSKLHET